MDVKLNLINLSKDTNNSEILIFLKEASDIDESAVAWQVIRNLGQGDNYPFVYPAASTIAASDSWGNYTPQLSATPGQLFAMVRTTSGDELVAKGTSSAPSEIQCANDLPQGAISVGIYKSGKLLATKTGIAPGQMAAFKFEPYLYIDVASQVVEGDIIDAAIISNIQWKLSLHGISSADIVMTDGSGMYGDVPFHFMLSNIVTAP